MRLFPHSFKFQMDPLYISWQLSHSRKKKVLDKESMQEEEASGVPSEARQNEKHFLFFLFSPSLYPLTLALNPELLKKPPRFLRPFPGVVCNNAGSVTVESLCIHRPNPQHCRPRDLPPACFLDSYGITNQHSLREQQEC